MPDGDSVTDAIRTPSPPRSRLRRPTPDSPGGNPARRPMSSWGGAHRHPEGTDTRTTDIDPDPPRTDP